MSPHACFVQGIVNESVYSWSVTARPRPNALARVRRRATTPLVFGPLLALAMSGADLNAATVRGDRAAVTKLLEAGVSPDYSDTSHNGAYPLHRCAWRGFPEIAEMLLQRGATVDCQNTNGATPLHNTAMTNQPAVAKVSTFARTRVGFPASHDPLS